VLENMVARDGIEDPNISLLVENALLSSFLEVYKP
jgi:hypothetical protein